MNELKTQQKMIAKSLKKLDKFHTQLNVGEPSAQMLILTGDLLKKLKRDLSQLQKLIKKLET